MKCPHSAPLKNIVYKSANEFNTPFLRACIGKAGFYMISAFLLLSNEVILGPWLILTKSDIAESPKQNR